MWAKWKGGDYCELESYSILPIDKRVLWKPADVQRVDFINELKSYRNDKETLIPYWCIISPNCQRQAENVDFRRNGMSFFGGQHSGVYSPYAPLHLPA